MQLNPLTAISPVDGRYFAANEPLTPYFSEYGLMRYRVLVEVEYFIALRDLPLPELSKLPKDKLPLLRNLYKSFDEAAAREIKEIESKTNHDVKAVEYYLKKQLDRLDLSAFKEFIHFGLTSQDINNTAVPMLIKEFLNVEFIPLIKEVIAKLEAQSSQWATVPMLARTHGQPASPTRLGKELQVFAERITKQLSLVSTIPHSAKFGGATGNFNAHHIAYPEIDWVAFGNNFVSKYLGLTRSHPTTQIEHYDNLAALLDNFKRINTILIDYCRDLWQYVSMDYFKQKIREGEVGSSAMPHKVNPIDFENAEGNLGIANALFEHLSSKLPISRLQRDLTDSTVIRNVGVPFAHSFVSLKSIMKGMDKLELNEASIRQDLENNWAVVAEAIQTLLRKEGYPNPYEALKNFTRVNTKITHATMTEFIDSLKVSETLKKKLKEITPFNYTGI